ncbi:HIT family protein [Propionibacteriaceae bacterium Y1923]|uniref:HIT family protein n=1 Tax=Aestuariimicrobium sp. Y1814 TaxID=3418742 RepID=UPI003C249D57
MSCVFCAIAGGEIPVARIAEDEAGLAFPDANPKSPGHLLVIPHQHVADLGDGADAYVAVAPLVARVSRLVSERLGADGVNLVVNSGESAGQEVFHLHVHVIPRYGRSEPPADAQAAVDALSGA